MDEPDKEKTTSTAPPLPAANSGGVMDVQPPKPAVNNSAGDQRSFDAEKRINVSSEPQADQAPPEPTVEDKPLIDTSSEPEQPTAPVDAPDPEPKDSESKPEPTSDNPMAINQPPAHKKSGAPKAIIAIAIIIAIGLASLVVFSYLKTRDKAKEIATSTQSSNPTASEAVTVAEIDQVSKETDESLNKIDDNADFPVNDLTDPSLGL